MPTLRSTMLSLLFVGAIAGASSAMPACSSVSSSTDCTAVCDRYKACFQSDYDISTCHARCSSMAGDSSFALSIETCSDCLGASCSSTAFNCSIECSGVVP